MCMPTKNSNNKCLIEKENDVLNDYKKRMFDKLKHPFLFSEDSVLVQKNPIC
nr:MAG TPA_asm: hypothetical protein [Caudoviricetes sp.]